MVKPSQPGYPWNQLDETHVMVTLAKGKTHGATGCAWSEL
jgi:hypothetical protein